MKHYGDICKIRGTDVPPVEVVIGGSPCQDLSVAGKRTGLDGERSGLFMEQIRLIKEMREHDRASGRTDDAIRPRYMVWENVPGAFSSNKGEDFRIVLEETARIADSNAVIPRPSQRWTNSGAVVGDGWSIAWRVLDAQFWGVPQRRRRIALVADFGGLTAPPILFERDSVQGDIKQSGETGQGTAGDVENGIGDAIPINTMIATRDKQLGERTGLGIGESGAPAYTISVAYCICSYKSNAMKSDNPNSGIYEADTSRTLDNNGGSPACNQDGMAVVQSMGFRRRNGAKSGSVGCTKEQAPTLGTDGNAAVYDARGNGDGDTAPTLTGDHQNRVTDYTAIISIDRAAYNQGVNAKYNIGINDDGKAQTLTAKGPNAVYTASHGEFMTDVSTNVANTLQATDYKDPAFVCPSQSIVRRLTPLECERLQGYPDHWTDIGEWTDSKGKKHKAADSPRYKALGNSIALPPWVYVLTKLNAYCKEHTMASLFDGIGGFPLIWEYLNGKGSAVWCSEIEEFPIAVTKLRLSEI